MSKDELATSGDTEEKKPAMPPQQLPDRVRVCGRWRPRGYKPTKAERDKWLADCKAQGRDPKTGRIKNDPTAPDAGD